MKQWSYVFLTVKDLAAVTDSLKLPYGLTSSHRFPMCVLWVLVYIRGVSVGVAFALYRKEQKKAEKQNRELGTTLINWVQD